MAQEHVPLTGAACARRRADEGYEAVAIDRTGDAPIADLSDPALYVRGGMTVGVSPS